MIRECEEHGYFRGTKCPLCDKEGHFLMDTREMDSISRLMAGTLRHFPEKMGVKMDEHGFVDINDLVQAIKSQRRSMRWLRPKHIIALARTDEKNRYEIRGDLIRATYGHTIDLDLDLPTDNIPERLYYPTTEEDAYKLIEEGIAPSDRKMVHLSATSIDAKNAGIHKYDSPVILEIDAKNAVEDGNVIMKAGTSVYLTKFVDPKYIKLAQDN